jgi:hypothetical protein
VNTDRWTTWLGFLGSLLLVLEHQGIIDKSLATLLSAILSALFGYLTNKVRIKRDTNRRDEKTTNISGMDLEI